MSGAVKRKPSGRREQQAELDKRTHVSLAPRRGASIEELAAWYPAARALIVIAGKASMERDRWREIATRKGVLQRLWTALKRAWARATRKGVAA